MSRRGELEMSPAEFLADIEVAVTDRNVVLPQPDVVCSVSGDTRRHGIEERELGAAVGETC